MQQERNPNDHNNRHNLTGQINRPIVLVGLMGSGKTTVGKRLANALNLPFVDADHEIETAANRSISEIFEQFGESHFRDGERRVIARLCEQKPMIIATGGGAFINDETRQLIKENTISIWLDCDIAILAERVSRKDTRPLLRGKDPFKTLSELAKIRNPIYAESDIRISGINGPHSATVKAIVGALTKWLT